MSNKTLNDAELDLGFGANSDAPVLHKHLLAATKASMKSVGTVLRENIQKPYNNRFTSIEERVRQVEQQMVPVKTVQDLIARMSKLEQQLSAVTKHNQALEKKYGTLRSA